MGFQKGNNFGGRTIGAKNKISQEIRETFLNLLKTNLSNFQDDLKQLEPKDRLKILLDIGSFCIPKLKAIEINEKVDTPQPLEVNFHYTTEELENRVIELIKERDENYD